MVRIASLTEDVNVELKRPVNEWLAGCQLPGAPEVRSSGATFGRATRRMARTGAGGPMPICRVSRRAYMSRGDCKLRLSARDLRRWARITGFEPVGIGCVEDLAAYVQACKAHY